MFLETNVHLTYTDAWILGLCIFGLGILTGSVILDKIHGIYCKIKWYWIDKS